MDKTEVIKAIAINLGDLVADDSVGSPTGTSVNMLALVHPLASQLKGYGLYVYSGGGSDQFRIISDFTPASHLAVIGQPFTTVPSTNSKAMIFQAFNKDDYFNAVHRAVGVARTYHLEEATATLALIGTTYENAVPSGFEYISRLRLVPTSGSAYEDVPVIRDNFEILPDMFRIEPNPVGSLCIIFDPRFIALTNLNNQWVRVYGQAQIASASTIPNDISEFVIAHATTNLSIRRIREGDEWRNKFFAFKGDASILEKKLHTPRRGVKVG